MENYNKNSCNKIFKPKDLNDLLLEKTIKLANKFEKVDIIGDIINYKDWKRYGCSFDISMNDSKIVCKFWEKNNLDISLNEIKDYSNTRCIVSGILEAEYFYGHKFIINVNSIKLVDNKTKLNSLKLECKKMGYFENKKNINWESVNKICIISKKNTQGYNDFISLFNVPLNIKLEEISLEGNKTSKECINIIKKLERVDLIIIIRGGGDTGEISNAFDSLELFETMKKSKIPIITAIGHEQDKDDKLLITNVSDIDFPTPTACAKDLNKKLYNKLLENIDKYLRYNYDLFVINITKIIDNEFINLYNSFDYYYRIKLGGKIVEIDDNDECIIIKKNGNYYKNEINFDNQIKLTENDIKIKNIIFNAIEKREIDLIEKNIKNLKYGSSDNNIMIILKNIEKIKKKIEIKKTFFNLKDEKIDEYFLKEILLDKKCLNYLIKIRKLLLWYKKQIENSIDNKSIKEIKDIYMFLDKNLR